MMWQQDQEEDDDLFDELPENFILCALHQAKTLRERWKYWSGSVPADVSVHLHRLESRLSITKEFQRCRSISPNVDEHLEPLKTHKIDISANTSAIPLQRGSNLNSSEPFLTNMQNPTSIDQYLNDRIEPKQKIIIEGPDIRRLDARKRHVHFWCCH